MTQVRTLYVRIFFVALNFLRDILSNSIVSEQILDAAAMDEDLDDVSVVADLDELLDDVFGRLVAEQLRHSVPHRAAPEMKSFSGY